MDVTAGSLSEFDGEAGAGAKSCEDATRESQLDFFVTALFSENAFIVAIFNWATVFVRSEVRNFSKHFTLCLSTSRGESDATFRRVGSKIFPKLVPGICNKSFFYFILLVIVFFK